jgi:hypothetical protein
MGLARLARGPPALGLGHSPLCCLSHSLSAGRLRGPLALPGCACWTSCMMHGGCVCVCADDLRLLWWHLPVLGVVS